MLFLAYFIYYSFLAIPLYLWGELAYFQFWATEELPHMDVVLLQCRAILFTILACLVVKRMRA